MEHGEAVPSGTDPGLRLVVFRLEGQRYAIPLAVVDRVIRAVEVTPLPGAPPIVIGLINIEGRMVPVLNVRRRFQMPEREISLTDHFLIVRSDGREVALIIDEAENVVEHLPSAVKGSAHVGPGTEQFDGAIDLGDGLVLIHDVQKFLSLDEARALDDATRPDA